MGFFKKVSNILLIHHQNKDISKKDKYNFETIEEIESIKIPSYPINSGISSPVNNIEYILQRKATEFKKEGKEDLAIACLKKANEIFPYSNFSWNKKDYMRVVEFLKDFGRFNEARTEKKYILDNYRAYFGENALQQNSSNQNAIDAFMSKHKDIYYSDGSDLVTTESTARCCTCEICSRYRGRIFSVYGKDSRFPKLPEELRKMYIHRECALQFSPIIFFKGCNNNFNPTYDPSISLTTSEEIIRYVNRPFTDDRTPEEIECFEHKQLNCQAKIQDRKDYDWLREHLPEQSPKSFGGYRKMKNANSANYIKLKNLALQKGYIMN